MTWFSMDNKIECANCGKEGDHYTMVESVRRCGTGHGEWYCVPGQGCQDKKKVNHETK